jgi:hypothetical protein
MHHGKKLEGSHCERINEARRSDLAGFIDICIGNFFSLAGGLTAGDYIRIGH